MLRHPSKGPTRHDEAHGAEVRTRDQGGPPANFPRQDTWVEGELLDIEAG